MLRNQGLNVSDLRRAAAKPRSYRIAPRDLTLHLTCGESEYALRLHESGSYDISTIESELLWLNDIAVIEDNIVTPTPARFPSGAWAVEVKLGTCECYILSLVQWTKGAPKTVNLITLDDMKIIGKSLGHLHVASQRVGIPPYFNRRAWDFNGLFMDVFTRRVCAQPREALPDTLIACEKYLSEQTMRDILEACERSKVLLSSLIQAAHSYSIIHADLHPGNFLFSGINSFIIDFADCGAGYFTYDIASALWRFRSRSDWSDLSASLLRGYLEVKPLDDTADEQIAVFIAVRAARACIRVAMRLSRLGSILLTPSEREEIEDRASLLRAAVQGYGT